MIRVLSVAIVGPLERYAEGLCAHLLSLQYTRLSARNLLYLLAHLSRWLAARKLDTGALTSKCVAKFLRARRRAGYTAKCSPRANGVILSYLREVGALSEERHMGPRSALERVLAEYAEHLTHERSLADSTIRQRLEIAALFLEGWSTRTLMQRIRAADVRAFLLSMSRTHPRSLGGVGSNLRSLLRYLFVAGLIKRDLSPTVPATVTWSDRTLPRSISSSDVQSMLTSCDRRTLGGKRDYAILLLLARLGLRQCEVCALVLDDFDWQRGVLTVRGKGKKRAELPIPDDVGRAVTTYLLRRPRVDDREVFVGVRAPKKPLRAIGSLVRAASQRAGIAPVSPHRLRHTAASEMLRRGASLAEIGQVLRHASTQTTAIYAKVDRQALRTLVQPWPGVQS